MIISYSYKRYEQYRIRREVMNILSYVPLTSGSDDIDDLSNSLFLPLLDINNKNANKAIKSVLIYIFLIK